MGKYLRNILGFWNNQKRGNSSKDPKYIIRKATLDDSHQIGYVHYKSWLETYRGIVDDVYLDNLSVDSKVESAKSYYRNCFVAVVSDEIIGIATSDITRDDDLDNTLEIIGIYILKKYHNFGIGKALITKCFEPNNQYNYVSLWVSKRNSNAINAYKKIGFDCDGCEKNYRIGKSEIEIIRMIMPSNKIHSI